VIHQKESEMSVSEIRRYDAWGVGGDRRQFSDVNEAVAWINQGEYGDVFDVVNQCTVYMKAPS
jgi:hypothetical protein